MPNTGWLRVLFGLVFGQALLLGVAIIWPTTIDETLPWPASPLNARFIAALYCMGAATSLLAMLARGYREVRIPLVLVGILTGGLLLLTLPHLDEFTTATFPYRWVTFYFLDALIIGAVVWRLRGQDPVPPRQPRRSFSALLLLGYAAALTVAGGVMLVAPSFAVDLWPWNLTPILAQVYSVFFLTFAIGALLCARDPRPEAGRIFVLATIVMLVLILAVSVAYAERFRPGISTWLWYVLWGAALLAMATASVQGARGERHGHPNQRPSERVA
ncbi:MAG: hypothetical protein ACM30G_07765 [Micromonosporaceae bacterium]